MKEYNLTTEQLKQYIPLLECGDRIYLSGTVYTARDAAHKRIFELIDKKKPLPFEIKNSVIYYAGPTPTPEGLAIGSCGPTTSCRMDPYTPKLFDMGLVATIGKGERSEAVTEAIKRNSAVYLCAIGGAGALAALSITKCEVIAFEDLGCESVKKLTFKDFPLIVGIDGSGKSIFRNE
ncbi:MAG: fumarate hydratase C-terminal domain-containing protein [Clostridia bacterium]|nr:fumarate hydratase C-terminal domain-containing protein [Clostridia bacterium]